MSGPASFVALGLAAVAQGHEALARGRLDLAFLRVEPGFDLEYRVVDRELTVWTTW